MRLIRTNLYLFLIFLASPLLAQVAQPVYEIQFIASDKDDAILGTLTDGGEIDLLVTGNIAYGIIVNTPQNEPGSLRLELAGPRSRVQTENEAPFSVFGGVGSNKGGRLLPPGDYTLTLSPFEEDNLGGASGTPTQINFTVLPIRDVPLQIIGYRLLNADTEEIILEFSQDISLDLSALQLIGTPLAIEALTSPSTVGSVKMSLNGPLVENQTENKAPYSQFSNKNEDFFGQVLPDGSYELCAQAFSLANLQGYSGEESCVNIVINPTVGCPGGTFTQISNFGGGLRINSVGFSIGSKGYVGLGENSSNASTNDLWEYDPTSDTWSQVASLPSGGRDRSFAFVLNGLAYVGTGVNDSFGSQYNRELWQYNPNTNTWEQKADFPGNSREAGFAFAVGDKGYAGGGARGLVSFFDFYSYDPTSDSWTRLRDYPVISNTAQTFVIDGIPYVFGGGSSGNLNNQLWSYNIDQNLWVQKASHPDSDGRGSHEAFAIDGKGYIGLGFGSSRLFKNSFWEYDPIQDAWVFLENFCGVPVREASSFVIGSTAYFGTGLTNESGRVRRQDFWKFNPAQEEEPENVPEAQAPTLVNLYPNPLQSTDHLQVELQTEGTYQIDLITSEGNILQSYQVEAQGDKTIKQIQIPQAQLGQAKLLFLRVRSEKGESIRRVLR